jgi:carbamoyl-phosphate synthase small subunit
MKKYLLLENGTVFTGEAFGAPGDVIAEIVFNTAMTGYMETLTDKSYAGQAVVQTFPLIGNYGVIPEDAESNAVSVSAYIVREHCQVPSNFRSGGNLDDYLKQTGTVGISGIDTRALTRILRESGTMNGAIADDPDKVSMEEMKSYKIVNPVAKVSTTSRRTIGHGGKYRIALLDFGVKENILRSLASRDCEVTLLPWNTSAEDILKLSPDGIFLTNGPGDPTDNVETIETLKALIPHGIPTMGICLGHQLLALANGFQTEKLKYGHRGANHPVRDLETGRVHISSQNHGYAVVRKSIDPAIAVEMYINGNDGTNEGLKYSNAPAFSVQFHPEACSGPQDTGFLFDRFISML